MILVPLATDAVLRQLRESGVADLLAVLKAGFRLALLGRPSTARLRITPGFFWIAAALSVLLSFAQSYFAVDAPREFDLSGIQSDGFYLLLTLAVSFLMARILGEERLLWPLAVLMTCAGLVSGSATELVYYHVLPRWAEGEQRWYWCFYALSLLWWLGILHQTMSALGAGHSAWQRLRVAIYATAMFALVSYFVRPIHFWEQGYPAEDEQGPQPAPLIAEEVFSRQDQLLRGALARIAPGERGRPHLYFVAFSPYGEQSVFEREAFYAEHLFETRFGAAGRTLLLINHRDQLAQHPLATATNLERALKWLGAHMNAEQDILFLLLNSHGSRDAELSIELGDLSFNPLTADILHRMLKESGIRWKVLLVSSCFSGSFVPALKDEHTLLMTAARADRTSFGCSDTADFTYFGRAYLEQALNQTTSFTEAFAKAQALVSEWEDRDHYEHSEPQIASSAAIEAQLARWRATLPADAKVTPASAQRRSP